MIRKLQIFVSSTYTDLIPERQAAVAAILKAGHIPAGMELFTAGDKSQWEVIRKWIDQSDAYMLILGGRYGSVEPESGKSYTELEFDYAKSASKPLFSVVIDDSALADRLSERGPSSTELERPSELGRFRSKVLKHMSAFFSDEKDIKLAVYEGVLGFAGNKKLVGWVRGDEIADLSAINSEVSALRSERDNLAKKLAQLEAAPKKKSNDIDQVIKMLSSISVHVPVSAGLKEPADITLLNLFISSRDALANGITNQMGQHESVNFVYNNVCPRLQIHGLVANEKVAGKIFRRNFLTTLGVEVLAEIDKRNLASET